ncbi:MAG: hypothetical protein QOG51_1202 [Verrucomicrobiota bacterium]
MALRVISNVPGDKLKTILTDLQYEVGKANIKKTALQSDGLFRIEYDPDLSKSPAQSAPSAADAR